MTELNFIFWNHDLCFQGLNIFTAPHSTSTSQTPGSRCLTGPTQSTGLQVRTLQVRTYSVSGARWLYVLCHFILTQYSEGGVMQLSYLDGNWLLKKLKDLPWVTVDNIWPFLIPLAIAMLSVPWKTKQYSLAQRVLLPKASGWVWRTSIGS